MHFCPLAQFVSKNRGEMLHAFGCGSNETTRRDTATGEEEEIPEIGTVGAPHVFERRGAFGNFVDFRGG
jgi:hypothetical protein